MTYLYNKHKFRVNFKNRLLTGIIYFCGKLPRTKRFKNISAIQKHYDRKIKRKMGKEGADNIKELTVERITLFDIILLEEIPDFLQRVKDKQKKVGVQLYEQKRTEEYLNNLNLYSKGWCRLKVDSSIFLEKNIDNLDLQIIKQDDDFALLCLHIILPEKEKSKLKTIANNYFRQKYFGEVLSRKGFIDFFKYGSYSENNKIHEVGQHFENFLINYINQYQKLLGGFFYQEKAYPPIEVYIGDDGLENREHQGILLMPPTYDELGIGYACNDTKKKGYIENVKRGNALRGSTLLSHLTFLFDRNGSFGDGFTNKLSEIMLRSEGSIRNSSYLYSLNQLIRFLEKKIDKIYIDVSRIGKNGNITTEKIISFRNSLNPYFVLFQRLSKRDAKSNFKTPTKLQETLINNTVDSIERMKEKFRTIDSIIEFNVEYKVIETNKKLQNSMLLLTFVGIFLTLLALFMKTTLIWIMEVLPNLYAFLVSYANTIKGVIFLTIIFCFIVVISLLIKRISSVIQRNRKR